MRSLVLSVAIVMTAAPAFADEKCRAEVEAAYTKQGAVPKLRSVITTPIQGGLSGTAERTVDLVRPDKVYSRVKSTAEEGTAETIVIGTYGWSNTGMGWDEVKPNIAKVMSLDVIEMNKPQKVAADFNCLGKQTFEGKEYSGYRGAPGKAEDGTDLVTVIYVDEATGLPAHNIVMPASGTGTALLKVAYSYSDDIAVESPMAPTQTLSEKPPQSAPDAGTPKQQ